MPLVTSSTGSLNTNKIGGGKPPPQRGHMKIIAVDLDGTLCDQTTKKPYISAISNINFIANSPAAFLVIYTSRPEILRKQTEDWLRDNNVKYHALVMEKLRADFYIDRDNKSIDELVTWAQKEIDKLEGGK